MVIHQHLESFGAETVNRLDVLFAVLLRKKLDQGRDVFLALPQRRKLNVDHIEPVIKVFAESSFVHEPFRSEEHTSELQSRPHLVCRLLLEKKKIKEITVLPRD